MNAGDRERDRHQLHLCERARAAQYGALAPALSWLTSMNCEPAPRTARLLCSCAACKLHVRVHVLVHAVRGRERAGRAAGVRARAQLGAVRHLLRRARLALRAPLALLRLARASSTHSRNSLTHSLTHSRSFCSDAGVDADADAAARCRRAAHRAS